MLGYKLSQAPELLIVWKQKASLNTRREKLSVDCPTQANLAPPAARIAPRLASDDAAGAARACVFVRVRPRLATFCLAGLAAGRIAAARDRRRISRAPSRFASTPTWRCKRTPRGRRWRRRTARSAVSADTVGPALPGTGPAHSSHICTGTGSGDDVTARSSSVSSESPAILRASRAAGSAESTIDCTNRTNDAGHCESARLGLPVLPVLPRIRCPRPP